MITYQIQLDEIEQQETFSILQELGVTPVQAIKLFFEQIRMTHTLPFTGSHQPNAKTQALLLENDYSEGFNSVDDLFADLEK